MQCNATILGGVTEIIGNWDTRHAQVPARALSPGVGEFMTALSTAHFLSILRKLTLCLLILWKAVALCCLSTTSSGDAVCKWLRKTTQALAFHPLY